LGRPADPVDAIVVGIVEGYLARPDGPASLMGARDVPEIAELRAERDRLEAKIARAILDYDNEEIDAATLRAVKDRRTAEVRVVDRKLAAAAKTSQLAALAATPDPVAAFRQLGLNLRREIVNALVKITLLPARSCSPTFDADSVRIDWR
jgi:site-specific DNA recombinase